MNAVDQIISRAHEENPILGALLGVLMDGGRIVSSSSRISELLSMVPDVFFFEQKDLSADNLGFFSDYDAKDLIFIDENASVDMLWDISHRTGAQVALFSQIGSDEALCDYILEEKDLRSALMNIRPLFEKLKVFKGQVSLDGSRLNKALFLDRDGVVIDDKGYIQNPEDVELVPEIIPLLKHARSLGYRLMIVTNQSGIGRGMFNFSSYDKVNERMLQLLSQSGVVIDRVVKAAYYDKSKYASGLVRKSLRKPRPGMFHSVVAEFGIDLSSSVMVGDRARDLMAAAVSGVRRMYLVESKDLVQESQAWGQWPLRSRFEGKDAVSAQGSIQQVIPFLDRFNF